MDPMTSSRSARLQDPELKYDVHLTVRVDPAAAEVTYVLQRLGSFTAAGIRFAAPILRLSLPAFWCLTLLRPLLDPAGIAHLKCPCKLTCTHRTIPLLHRL